MIPSTPSRRAAVCCFLAAVTAVSAHMEMSWPYPFRSRFNPLNTYTNIDYSMTSPLSADGSDFPCKGYQNDRPVQLTAKYAAGLTYNLTLSGSATHHGGSCQLSLSYDNGATFRVIKSMIGGCPLTSTYNFTIPPYAPNGNALLAWTWQNNEGNREYYMNCAPVNVISRAHQRRKRQAFNTFDSLPFIWKANLKGINDCVTIEGEDPVYPHPGPDVIYGEGSSSSSSPFPGTCDSPTPYGQTYKDLGGNNSVPAEPDDGNKTTTLQPGYGPSNNVSARATYEPSLFTTASTNRVDSSPTPTAPAKHGLQSHVPKVLVPTQSSSTATVIVQCVATTTVTLSLGTYSGSATSGPTSQPLPSTPETGTTPTNSPPSFASGDLTRYLPCVPGTFICTSSTTWATCGYNDGSGQSSDTWVYAYPRQVAAGVECLPLLSPYSGQTEQYGQQTGLPSGSYRDDRLVRVRPDGDCSTNGSLQCTDGGHEFDICDQGGWVPMGSVAAGTICMDGAIIAA